MNLFLIQAQRWVNNTRTCAMRRIAEYYKKDEIECYDFHHKAEHIYSDCSRTNGVCSASMMWGNRQALKNVYVRNFRWVQLTLVCLYVMPLFLLLSVCILNLHLPFCGIIRHVINCMRDMTNSENPTPASLVK